ncbi:MAG TPA: tetratricopeptide repeat protein [Candidatus Angelobacter sp.]|nr:tetratricopeptide repeat protein [Candidatus Angelobacter sp.]
MTANPRPSRNAADRLDSWKEIASYLRRDVRTVQRWEKKEGLPVYRHQHDKLGSVYAYKPELDAWFNTRQLEGPDLEPAQPAKDGKIKLAVLPFSNLNADPEQDYFSDGLTEEMITQLTRLQPGRLGVIAVSTAMHYKASHKPLGQIKSELGVDYILQGRVRRAADRVRITAQLVELKAQTQLWAETYERDLRDILAVQADIAQAIAREIHILVSRPEQARLSDLGASSGKLKPGAYENYLKARYHLHGMTAATVKKSIESFEAATREDAEHAPSYAGLASAYALLAIAPFDLLPPHEAMPKAESAARKSLELDDSLAEAHTALALVLHHYHWDWKGAEASYRRAIELNPDQAPTHLWYSWLLLALGRQEDALKEIEQMLAIVQQTDPHRVVAVHVTRAAAYYFSRDYERAAQECKKALELNPNYFMLHYILAQAYARRGMTAEAIAELRSKGAAAGEVPLMDAALGLAYGSVGKKGQTEKIVEAFKAGAKKRYVPATYFGMLYAGLGDRDQALTWLEKAYEERADGLTWINVDPMLDPLRNQPRFQELVKRIGLL